MAAAKRRRWAGRPVAMGTAGRAGRAGHSAVAAGGSEGLTGLRRVDGALESSPAGLTGRQKLWKGSRGSKGALGLLTELQAPTCSPHKEENPSAFPDYNVLNY